MPLKIEDLVASVGIAPKIGQVPTRPVGVAGWSKPPVSDSEDLRRIIALPRRAPPTGAQEQQLIDFMTQRYARSNDSCRCAQIRPEGGCIKSFRLAQSWAMLELETQHGLLGAIGVGHGKTLLGIMAAMAMPDCKTALILVPPRLVDQLIVEYELASEHFRTPSLVVHNGTNYARLHDDNRPILRVMPYSRLSRKTATTFIKNVAPDFIMADEVHKLKDRNTATASRVLRYFIESPETRFAGWTGSLTDKSLNDYGHLAALALRFKSPLPLDPHTLDDWARAIDPSDFPAPAGELFALCNPGEEISSGFHRRLTETAGMVATRKAAIDAHLVVTERKAPPMPMVVKEAMESIRNFVRPDGEELVEAYEVARSAREAACGFFYRWTFPRGEKESEINAWLSARKAWNKELRAKLFTRDEYLDSPLLCEEAAIRAWNDEEKEGLPSWRAVSWPAWSKVKGTVRPETEAVRLDPYLAQDAADWGLSKRGVIWYNYSALGNWIGELSGLPVHGGGPKSDVIIAREKGDRSIIASIHAHGTGRDGLQRLFSTQLITSPMSSAQGWEQLLGRLHRLGQDANLVTAEVYRHTREFKQSIDRAMSRALYVQETLGSSQKLRAGYSLDE